MYRFFKYSLILSFSFIILSQNVFALDKSIIYVYNDEGVGQQSLTETLNFLNVSLPSGYKVEKIDASHVVAGDWINDAALFVMPGGADLPYVAKLNGKGNQHIKNFVNNGGSYLGICAGSYYGSSYVQFDKSGPLEVLGNRELGFYPGKAVGPILSSYDYKSEKGARAAHLSLNFPDMKDVNVYYNGGGYFEAPEKHSNVSVLAEYNTNTGKLPAIIYVNAGNGHVVLSGVHFEYDARHLDQSNPYLKKIIPEIKKTNSEREKLMVLILEKLNIPYES